MKRDRRSAKAVINQFASELLNRHGDKDAEIKLLTIETIALKMGWNDLYDRLRFRKKVQAEREDGPRRQWWQD